jgi:putative ABC transport system substrate-binding protein
MAEQMQRREFITLLGGAAATYPLAARAQQPSLPVVGFLNGSTAASYVDIIAAFRRGLIEAGVTDGRDVVVEFRWADNDYDRLPLLVAELIRRPVAVLAASGVPAALAAKAATTTIPVVFEAAFDPVEGGLVASLNRPGGNVTGITLMARLLTAKRLELLRDLVPNSGSFAVLINPNNPTAHNDIRETEAIARALGQNVLLLTASSEVELRSAFAKLVQQRVGALYVSGDPFFGTQRELIVLLSIRHGIPTVYDRREYVAAGGLVSYGGSFLDAHRQVGVYVGRILKGETPSNLPVVQPTKFDLVLNLKIAKVLGLKIPPKLLALADEVIE